MRYTKRASIDMRRDAAAIAAKKLAN